MTPPESTPSEATSAAGGRCESPVATDAGDSSQPGEHPVQSGSTATLHGSRQSPGHLIVLSADRTLMAGYNLLFDGMLAASQTTTTPIRLLGSLLLPQNRGNAPLGLRRIEAALVAGGFTRQEICVCEPERLADRIGSQTRVIGLSAGEPGGGGMNSSTMSAVAGGRIWPQAAFTTLAKQVRRLRNKAHPAVKVVMGGAGAWQVARDESLRQRLGIDYVIGGYAENEIAAVFRALVDGQGIPVWRHCQTCPASGIPAILGPTTMGAVEISRGCGLGCDFCTIARTGMSHLTPQAIERDVRTNIAGGQDNISLLTEDVFRYGSEGRRANPPALIELLRRLRQVPSVRLLQVDHANLFSAAQFSDTQLHEVRELLGRPGQKYVWLNIGVETPDGALLQELGGGAKMGDCRPADWGEFCHKQLTRLCEAGFLPFVSLLLCCPGQTQQHIGATSRWLQRFEGMPITFFPMLLAPIDGSPAPQRADLLPEHWRLIRECYRFNFTWLPRMIWDNQRLGGERLWRCAVLQAMGQGQMALWQTLFAWWQWRARW